MKFKYFWLVLFFLSFVGIFILGIKILDPDFGWQLKNGQTFLTTGVFYKDPYSYTMPSFPVVSHEWGSDVLIAVVYNYFGFYGLSFVFTLLFLIPLFVFDYFSFEANSDVKFLKTAFLWNLSVLTLTIGIFFNYFYVRPQIFSWILWMPLVLLLINRKWFNKYRFYLPFLFLVWANLHGGFAIGIFFVFFVAIFSSLQTKRVQVKNFFVAFCCFLATLVNPFGLSLWREVIVTFFNSNLRTYIGEWKSVFSFGFTFLDFLLFFVVSISIVLLWYFRRKINLEIIIIYVILLILGVNTIKNLPFLLIFNLVLFQKLICLLYKQIEKNQVSITRFKKAGVFVFVCSIILSVLLYCFYISTVQVTFQYYPDSGVNYLNANWPKGEIFSQYGWGGYLIWKLPYKKVFIDGRMGIWSWDGNKLGEINNAFDEYNKILTEKVNFNNIAKKYNIDTVLWPKENNKYSKSFGYKLDKEICKYIRLSRCMSLNQKSFESILKDDGWHLIYTDSVSVIYKK